MAPEHRISLSTGTDGSELELALAMREAARAIRRETMEQRDRLHELALRHECLISRIRGWSNTE